MGSAASSAYTASHGLVHEVLNKQEQVQQQQQQQQPPKLLTFTLAGEEDLSGDDTDDSPPRLIDATDHLDDLDQDASREVCRKALLLPTTHAQHVGRLVVKPGCGTSTGQVVWVVPARALGGSSSPQSPTAAATGSNMCTTSANTTGPGEAPARVLLSPTFILPCGLSVGCRGASVTQLDTPAGQVKALNESSTEWQLMLEPSTVFVSSPPSPQLAPSSPTCTSTTSTPADPDSSGTGSPGATLSPTPVTAPSGGPDKVQVWTPTIRFLWSPACNTTPPVNRPAQSAPASQTASPVAALAGVANADSHESSDPGHTATNQTGSSGSSSNSSESDPMDTTSVPDSSSSGGSGIGSLIKDAEKKLLPSSWSTRKKKNLAPASYRAAYSKQAKGGVAGSSSTLAPAAGSQTRIIPEDAASSGLQDQGRHAQVQGSTVSTVSSSSSWCLRCTGKLAVTLGPMDAAASDQDMDQGPGPSMHTLRVSAGFVVELQEFGGTWGAPFSLCSKHTPQPNSTNGSGTEAAATCISSNTQQLQLSFLEHGSGASGSAWDRAAGSGHPKQQDSKVDELCIAVDFDQLQLLLLEPNSKANTTSSTAGSNNSSTAHQKHHLGLSPPHTPNKASSSSNTAAEHASGGSTGSGTAALTAPAAAAAVVSRPSRLARARQLEAFLLSHSPRMLVIDNFFSPGLCNELMELARSRLVRSRVASGSETPNRTSWGHFFVKDAAKHHLIVEAEAQIEALFNSAAVRGGYGPLAKVEALQVVRYHKGEFYHEHYDNRADGPLTRAATILVYLCDTEEGGATSFSRAVTGFGKSPDADALVLPPKVTVGPGGRGIKIFPVQGRALVFWSKRPNGDEDPNSIHAAETVVAGEKWIATRWMKDNL